MRALLPLILLAVVGCAAQDDSTVTDDGSELVEGRSLLERDLDPPIAPPAPAVIGKKMSDALTESTAGTTSAGKVDTRDGCTIEKLANSAKAIVAEHELCKHAEILRVLDAKGDALTTFSDLNGDGKIDHFAGQDGAFILYADDNFDGKVDQTVERVDHLKDFSTKGYGETFPASKFVHRVRDDRNKDGKLDHEKLIAKALLPPAASAH